MNQVPIIRKNMGWMDNLDNDPNDDQPGPSGLSNSDTSHTIVEELTNAENLPQGQNDENPEPDDKAQPQSPFELFIDKVTIAGLKEAFEEIVLPIKYMYRIAIFLFSIMIIYQSIKIANQYMNQSSILDTFNVINERAPFPNISVCYPFFFNTTEATSMGNLISSTDKRASAMARDHNFTGVDIINSVRRMVAMDGSMADLGTPVYLFTRAVYDQIVHANNEKGQDTWQHVGVPECASVVSECKINGQPFDCCTVATPMAIGLAVCYQIEVGKLIHQNDSHASDETRVELKVSTDWEYGVFDNDNSASDGYHIFIDSVPFQGLVPASVPTGMDGSIVLGEPEKLSQIKECLPNGNDQHLKYFDYYEPQGVQCIWDHFLSMQLRLIGCMLPAASYFPFNQSCTYAQLSLLAFTITTVTGVDDLKMLSLSSTVNNDDALEKLKNLGLQEKNNFADIVARRTSSCRPLCSRWEYPVLSVSYAEIEYRDEAARSNNISWSRLNIILPYASSIDRQERKIFSASYMALCDIGGTMGVWLGFSVITIVQLLIYGGYFLISIDVLSIGNKMKRRLVMEADTQTATASNILAKPKSHGGLALSVSDKHMTMRIDTLSVDHKKEDAKSSDHVRETAAPRKSGIPVLVNLAAFEKREHIHAGIEIRQKTNITEL